MLATPKFDEALPGFLKLLILIGAIEVLVKSWQEILGITILAGVLALFNKTT